MIHARLLAFASIFPLTVACQSAYAAQAGTPPKAPAAGLLPPARTALEIQVSDKGSPSLAQLLQQLGGATGVTFTSIAPVEQQLTATPCNLSASVTVPPQRAWMWVECLLEQEGYSLGVLSASEPFLVAVYSGPMGGRPYARVYTPVPASQIDALAEHPALWVTTSLELPHTDVRQLGNSLRALSTDPTGEAVIMPVGNTSSVILTGTGRSLHQLVELLVEIDAREAAAQERRAQEPAHAGAQTQEGAR